CSSDLTLMANSATNHNGGGAHSSTLNNCLLTSNSARFGGGAYVATLNNCTLTANSSDIYGGGAYSCTLNNCVVYYNTALITSNYDSGTLNFCCTTPLAAGPGNFTNAPLFADTNKWNNLRLLAASPCIDAGTNAYAPSNVQLSDAGSQFTCLVSNAYGTMLSSNALLIVASAVHYVAPANSTPTNPYPYTSWASAATNIQNAVDAAAAGEVVAVTNG